MNIREMHYDFLQKLNKLDSHQYKHLKIFEIDWKLNEACEMFVKMIAQPRQSHLFGFETNQRTIDDIRTIVKNDIKITPQLIGNNLYKIELPEDYMFYISSEVLVRNSKCGLKKCRCIVRQQDDRFEDSPFDKSSYEWGEINITFYEEGIKIYCNEDLVPINFILNYIKKPVYMHNAQDFLPTGSYKHLSLGVLTGSQDCELPTHTHREIVDLAVMITTIDLDMPNSQYKQLKTQLNQV